MVNRVEEALDVPFNYSGNSFPRSNRAKGGMAPTLRAKSMGTLKELGFQDFFHYYSHSLLNYFVTGGAEGRCFPLALGMYTRRAGRG